MIFHPTTNLKSHGYLDKPLHHLPLGEQLTLLLLEPVVEVTTFTETHHYVQLAVSSFPGLPVCHDVGMPQPREELRLLLSGTPFPLGGGDQIQLFNHILQRGEE